MKITIDEDHKDKAKRLIACDEAFSLLWDIDQRCRAVLKYDHPITRDEVLEVIRADIAESGLLEMYE